MLTDSPPDFTITSRSTVVDEQQQVPTATPPRYALVDRQTNTVTLMSSLDAVAPSSGIEQSFRELADRWREETMHLSSTPEAALNFSYQQIIGMGKEALPLIFREMQTQGGHWFWALAAITRENPVQPEDRGKVRRMTQAWLEWGRENGYLQD
jgi:hypothetical protein